MFDAEKAGRDIVESGAIPVELIALGGSLAEAMKNIETLKHAQIIVNLEDRTTVKLLISTDFAKNYGPIGYLEFVLAPSGEWHLVDGGGMLQYHLA